MTIRPLKWQHFDAVIRNAKISLPARGLFAILMSYADEQGACWPSLEKLMADTGYKERALRNLLNELIEKGAITKIRRGRTLTNLYNVTGIVVPVSDRHSGAGYSSDRHSGAGVTGTTVQGDRHSGAIENAIPPYSPNGCGDRNSPINRLEGTDPDLLTTPSGKEAEFISVLKTIKGYPLDLEKDLSFYQKLRELFPDVNIIEEAKKWAVYKMDKPLKKNSNPRSQFRNWLEIASKKQKEVKRHNDGSNKKIKPVAKPSSDFSDWLG
ncbi:Helix-turn-helix domain-containing protein [Desulfofundulus australicus DSM 11792]|uniref:Helix-turn-helix domain-containing protein n=1 Tax=Desulfofundulus australicus DSM 11792 TaxID=1121425 RepID=A0A1M5E6P8_9FIRM|nr:helix-turn-helix domain-containing protein [Desulfofundulus australicus]SHF74860.1 Helix-turn-helix domain-containing protein [Desulfofundulus australicus DSM 11792]